MTVITTEQIINAKSLYNRAYMVHRFHTIEDLTRVIDGNWDNSTRAALSELFMWEQGTCPDKVGNVWEKAGIDISQPVAVYRNVTKNCFSVQQKVNGSLKVLAHVPCLYLTDVEYKVSEASRQRVLKEKRKNVHAKIALKKEELDELNKVHGYISSVRSLEDAIVWEDKTFNRVWYNPYLTDSFKLQTKQTTITQSYGAFLNIRGASPVWAVMDREGDM